MKGLSKPRTRVTAFNIRGAPGGPRTAGHNRESQTDARPQYKTSGSGNNFPSCRGDHDLSKCQDFEKKTHDDRIKIVRRARLCYNCLTEGHVAMGCTERNSCRLDGCKRKHVTLLHPPDQPKHVDEVHGIQQSSAGTMGSGQYSAISRGRKVRLQIVPVRVRGKKREEVVETYALLDNGSDITLCDERLREQLGIEGIQRSFFLTTKEKKNSVKNGLEVKLVVEALDGSQEVELHSNSNSNSLFICTPAGALQRKRILRSGHTCKM